MIRRFLFCPGASCPDPGGGGGPLGEFGLGGVTLTCYAHRAPFDASPGVVHGAAVCAPGSVGIVGGASSGPERDRAPPRPPTVPLPVGPRRLPPGLREVRCP